MASSALFAKAVSSTAAASTPRRRFSCSLASRRRPAFVGRRTVSAAASSDENDAATSSLPILYDIPVSNNGARARLVIYWKNLEGDFAITNPSALGGIKSDEYLALNPQGKMPLLVLPDGLALPESEVISQYICDAYAERGPSLIPDDPESRAVAALATRIHDVYLVPIQGCMYRAGYEPEARAKDIAEIAKQMDVIEGIMGLRTDGPFIAGAEPSTADAALFPTWVFIEHCLPKHFGWNDVFTGRPRTAAWWTAMRDDTCGARVYDEVKGGLEAWEENGRWATVGVEDHVKDTSHKWAY